MAKIKANCPYCGAENRYDPTAAGLHVSCSDCGARFQLDYDRPQRSCLGSCLTTMLVLLLFGVAAGGLLVYFVGWPLPWDLPFDLPFVEVAEEAPQQPVAAPPQQEPNTEIDAAPDSAPVPETAPKPGPAEETAPVSSNEPIPEPPQQAFELREWVDRSGSFRVTARLLDFTDGLVRLEKENGDVIEVPLERLSENDRDYVREMFRDEGVEN